MEKRWHHRDLTRKIGRGAGKDAISCVSCISINYPSKKHLQIGKKGEEIAQKYLKSIGYELRDTNVRIMRDEIDIIALDPFDNVLVFAEVKTRSSAVSDIDPAVNMTMSKKRKVCRSARHWICNHQYDGGYRIDIIYIVAGKVLRHVKEMEWTD